MLRVREAQGFREYVAAIGARVDAGNARDAMFLLRDAGASAQAAWEIVSGWPRADDFGKHPADVIYGNRQQKAAVRMAHFIPTFGEVDWHTFLARGLRMLAARDSKK